MKKHVAVIGLLSICFFSNAQDKPQVTIKFSELYATYNFVTQLSDYYPDSEYKTIYKNSEYNTDRYNKLVEQLDTLSISESVVFSGYPKGQKLPLMTTNIIDKNLIASKTLAEFKTIMFGIIPSAELFALTTIIECFQPVYNALIYAPNKENFEIKVAELLTFVENENVENYFETGLLFYNTAWDNAVTFEIAVIPSLNQNGFTASAFMNNAVSEIQLEFEEYDILFSVLMHEIYHIFYNEQSLKLKLSIDKWFKENSSSNSQYAYLLLNEALATVLGNGYVYEQINNELDKYEWYNNKYINLMAKQLFPMVKEYILQHKSIDKAFIETYISIYDNNFSNWVNELDNILTYIHVIADDANDFDFFLENYPRTSYMYMEDMIDLLSVSRLKEDPVTKIIIISKNNSNTLKTVKSQLPELANWKYKPKKEFVSVFDCADKTKLIIVNCINSSANHLLNDAFENRTLNKTK